MLGLRHPPTSLRFEALSGEVRKLRERSGCAGPIGTGEHSNGAGRCADCRQLAAIRQRVWNVSPLILMIAFAAFHGKNRSGFANPLSL